MKKKSIWYCTGCAEKCAVKITEVYSPYRNFEDACLLFSTERCKARGFRPDWHKHEPQKRETKVEMPF